MLLAGHACIVSSALFTFLHPSLPFLHVPSVLILPSWYLCTNTMYLIWKVDFVLSFLDNVEKQAHIYIRKNTQTNTTCFSDRLLSNATVSSTYFKLLINGGFNNLANVVFVHRFKYQRYISLSVAGLIFMRHSSPSHDILRWKLLWMASDCIMIW